jgi:predicted nicotinamide N-methyase
MILKKVALLPSSETSLDDLDQEAILRSLQAKEDATILQQLETLISWTANDALASKLRTFRLTPALLKLLAHENEMIVETAASTMGYLSGRSGAGPYYRNWSFQQLPLTSDSEEDQPITTALNIFEPSYASGAGLGWKTWNAAIVLVEFLGLHPELFTNRDIIELGCGTGLSGIFCAAFGAKSVLMTDYNETVLQTVATNVERNRISGIVTTKRLDWLELIEQHASNSSLTPQYDTIIGSDIVYDPEHAEVVPKLLNVLLSHNESARVYIAIGPRPEAPRFMKIMLEEYDFEVVIHEEPNYLDAEGKTFHHDVLVYKRKLVQ